MFFTGFSGDFDGEFSLVFHGGNAMKISWKKHEKNSLKFNASWPMKKQNPMKMPWNIMKAADFVSWLFNDNEKAMN